eukprot:5889339-Alexandrium_andersonii.AAC.1
MAPATVLYVADLPLLVDALGIVMPSGVAHIAPSAHPKWKAEHVFRPRGSCLLYTSDAADDM